MSRRFGAWSRLVAAWRAIFAGAAHGDLHMPSREGEFFDPSRYPFLEGYGLGGSSRCTSTSTTSAPRSASPRR